MNAMSICINRVDQDCAWFELEPQRLLKWLELAKVYEDELQPVVFDAGSYNPEKPEGKQ